MACMETSPKLSLDPSRSTNRIYTEESAAKASLLGATPTWLTELDTINAADAHWNDLQVEPFEEYSTAYDDPQSEKLGSLLDAISI